MSEQDNIPSYLPDWVKRFIALGDSYLIVTLYLVMAVVPIALFGGIVWMLRGLWRQIKRGE